jgi:hypothetical protein
MSLLIDPHESYEPASHSNEGLYPTKNIEKYKESIHTSPPQLKKLHFSNLNSFP